MVRERLVSMPSQLVRHLGMTPWVATNGIHNGRQTGSLRPLRFLVSFRLHCRSRCEAGVSVSEDFVHPLAAGIRPDVRITWRDGFNLICEHFGMGSTEDSVAAKFVVLVRSITGRP